MRISQMQLAKGLAAGAMLCAFRMAPALAEGSPALDQKELDCLMEAHVTAKISASVAGLISKVYVDRGDLIRAGDVLAELESNLEKATVELQRVRAENDAQSKSNHARMEFLR